MTRPSELQSMTDANFDGMVSPLLFVSVIIPTYNRAETLEKTIESLARQTYPKDHYEIIVVDNNSMDSTRDVVERLKGCAAVEIQYLFEPRQGVHCARNTALKRARGDILYYTDDDMIADADLLMEIVKPFALSSKVATVTGRVLPVWEIAPPDWVLRLCNNYLLSLQDRAEHLIISPDDCGVFSCHQAIRRDAFIAGGGYNPENTAGEWIGDGETGLNMKLKELGYYFGYTGMAITHHVIPASRMTQTYLNRRLGNQGNCDSYSDFRKYKYSKSQLVRRITAHLMRVIFRGGLFLTKVALGKKSWRMELAYTSYFRKRALYDLRLLRDANWRNLVLKEDWLADPDLPSPTNASGEARPT
jgi:glucosyl-dolichyl phosphate glucuronosyltransferase